MPTWAYLSFIFLSVEVWEAELKTTFIAKAFGSQPSHVSQDTDAYYEDPDDYEDLPKLIGVIGKKRLISLSKISKALACSSEMMKSQEPLCLNGGTCISAQDDGYECRCSLEYTGQFCQFSNACVESPCKNGGTCQPFDDSGVCECPMGYTGIYCEIIDMQRLPRKKVLTFMPKTTTFKTLAIEAKFVADPCLSVQRKCQNNGKCIVTGDSTYECECMSDFSGDHCQYENPCRDYPCKNGGTCETFDDSGVCYCLAGFSGIYCEKSLQNRVIVDKTTPRPIISRLWRSRRKPKDACDSLESKCYNGGTCVPYGKKSFECVCPQVFAGYLCQFTNACEKNPCRNGGTCESYEDSGVCKCPYGFKGTYCESIDDTSETYLSRIRKGRRFPIQFLRSGNPARLRLDHCDNGEEDDKKPTCVNGGRCSILDEHSYECECRFGFTGKFCQFLDVCGSSPCLNGATCESYEDSGVCRCLKGFAGIFCEDEEVKVTLMTADADSSGKVVEVSKKRQESFLEHIYRSKIPAKLPYPMALLTHSKRSFAKGSDKKSLKSEAQLFLSAQDTSDRIKEGVISVPGFEDITKDMVRIGQDGTIYIRKPKKRQIISRSTSSTVDNTQKEYTHANNEQSITVPTAQNNLRILDASIVKVMPNGEIFLKVLLPKEYYSINSKANPHELPT